MSLNIFKPYCPNPFRFIKPHHYQWMMPIFYIHNAFYMRNVLGVRQTKMSDEAIRNLSIIKREPGHRLILANHSSFMDPPFLLDAFRRANRITPLWIAGNDVLYGMRGFREWYLASLGSLSLDRGIIDRRSLAYTQQALDEGNALLVFPEGEADFCNGMLRPFYLGACLFALNTALKETTALPVELLPVYVYAPFLSSPAEDLQKDCNQYLQDIQNYYPNNLKIDFQTADLKTHLITILKASLSAMGVYNYSVEKIGTSFLNLAKERLKSLYINYLPDIVVDENSFDNFQTVMTLKNRMSSHILRLTNAPEKKVTDRVQEKLQQIKNGLPSLYDTAQLEKLEHQFLGLTYNDNPLSQRVNRLEDMFKQMQPYIEQKANADNRLMSQWKEHSRDCRRVKLFYLIAQDIERHQLANPNSVITWENFDEILTKLEIAMLSKFRFRKPKKLEIHVGTPIDVKAFITENASLSKKALLQALTQKSYDAISKLMEQHQ